MKEVFVSKAISELVDNAEKCRKNPCDFSTLTIDGKEYILTTIDQIKIAVAYANLEGDVE